MFIGENGNAFFLDTHSRPSTRACDMTSHRPGSQLNKENHVFTVKRLKGFVVKVGNGIMVIGNGNMVMVIWYRERV